MNPGTNHLVDPSKMLNELNDQIAQQELLKALSQQGYKELPDHLQSAAKTKLNGKAETYVSKTSGGKLSNWASAQRKKAASKRRTQKHSRKMNR